MEPETTKHTSVATSFLDSQRTLALILGLHSGFLSCGVLVTSEELDKKKWMESQLFSGGVESSAVLKDMYVVFLSNFRRTVDLIENYKTSKTSCFLKCIALRLFICCM